MPYAVELYFDPQTEQAIRKIRQSLIGLGIPPTLDQLGDRPHISLALIPDLNVSEMSAALRNFSETTGSFPISLRGVDSFPGKEGVIYLAPAITEPLQAAHESLHQLLASLSAQADEYYRPGRWVPHCTIAQNVEQTQIPAILEGSRKKFRPIHGMLQTIGLIFYRPVRQICSFGLSGK